MQKASALQNINKGSDIHLIFIAISFLLAVDWKISATSEAMEYFDEYDHYNFDHVATAISNSRKGRTKREATLNTNRPNPAGHERKVTEKLRNTEKNRILAKGPRSK